MKNILKKTLYIISRSETFTKICRKVVDYNRNENNCDIETNGEGNFIKKYYKNFSIVFDVGANIGEWSNLMSVTLPNCKIYSFEPSKKTFATLQKNITNKNISTFNIGLGGKKEQKVFYNYGDDSTLNSSISRELDSNNKTEELVEFDTLENFCATNDIKQISFLKIDVEGGELDVLKGSEAFIKNGRINYIQFEYGGTYIDANILLKDIFKFFENKPYEIYKIMQKDLKKIDKYSQDLENFQYANFLAILKK
jgi:FkbM family methyltransferase